MSDIVSLPRMGKVGSINKPPKFVPTSIGSKPTSFDKQSAVEACYWDGHNHQDIKNLAGAGVDFILMDNPDWTSRVLICYARLDKCKLAPPDTIIVRTANGILFYKQLMDFMQEWQPLEEDPIETETSPKKVGFI